MRGHLIFKFKIGVCRLDTQATAAVVGGGYDNILREPKKIAVTGQQVGASSRREKTEVLIPCQVRHERFRDQNMQPGGHANKTRTIFTLHYRDLEAAGLVSATGDSLIRVGDRIAALYDRNGVKVEEYPNPPGLFVEQARSLGFGLFRAKPSRNLLQLTVGDRTLGAG